MCKVQVQYAGVVAAQGRGLQGWLQGYEHAQQRCFLPFACPLSSTGIGRTLLLFTHTPFSLQHKF